MIVPCFNSGVPRTTEFCKVVPYILMMMMMMMIIIIIIINVLIYLTANGLSPGGSGYNACT